MDGRRGLRRGVDDSRAYWPQGRGVGLALTEDDTGEFGAISAWLGADAEAVEPGIRTLRPSGPGPLLLCTDGLTRYLDSAEGLRAAIPRVPDEGGLPPAARELVHHALTAGGHDNVTTLLLPVAVRSR